MRLHHLSEVADAGQKDLRRRREPRRDCQHLDTARRSLERVLHGTNVARPVIENGDHSKPLVDGSWSFRRASVEQAYFMARAKHLKIASIL